MQGGAKLAAAAVVTQSTSSDDASMWLLEADQNVLAA
jgi:hypothetical protein